MKMPYPIGSRDTLGINGRNWTTLNNTLTGTLTTTSPMGRTIIRNYNPSKLLTQNQTVPGLLHRQLRLRHTGEDDLHHAPATGPPQLFMIARAISPPSLPPKGRP